VFVAVTSGVFVDVGEAEKLGLADGLGEGRLVPQDR
jgi:hypothetical protein